MQLFKAMALVRFSIFALVNGGSDEYLSSLKFMILRVLFWLFQPELVATVALSPNQHAKRRCVSKREHYIVFVILEE